MIEIPDKTYFKIGEVAKLLDLQPYVLRYWETEFDLLKPRKTKSGQRAYVRGDIELLVLVKTLLYDEMYTIAGARRQLKLRKKGAIEPLGPEAQQRLVSEHQTLLAERTAWATERERLTAAAESHREEADRLRIQNDSLVDENAQLAAAQLEYESSIKRLRQDLNDRRDVVESLERRMDEMSDDPVARTERAELDHALKQARERLATTVSERDALGSRVDELVASANRVEEMSSELAQTRAEFAALSSKHDNLVNELESLEADLASAESEIERLEAEQASQPQVDASELTALQEQLTVALQRIEGLKAEREELLDQRLVFDEQQRVHHATLRTELESLAALLN